MTLGLSISGAVFVNVAQNKIYQLLPNIPRDQVRQIVSGMSGNVISTLSEDLWEKVLAVIVSAWHNM